MMSSSPVFVESEMIPFIKPQIKRQKTGVKRQMSDTDSDALELPPHGKKTYKEYAFEDSDDDDDDSPKEGYTVSRPYVSKEHRQVFQKATKFWQTHAHDPLTVLMEFSTQISLRVEEIKAREKKNENSRISKLPKKKIVFAYAKTLSQIVSEHTVMLQFLELPHKKQTAIVKAAHHVLSVLCDFVYESQYITFFQFCIWLDPREEEL